MNYKNIYKQLVQKRKTQIISRKECYCEEHHITPLSEGGLDTKDNKVNLTAREHYIAHLLLAKIYDDFKMYSAITYMQTGRHKDRQFKYNNRLYGKIREEFGKKSSEMMKGIFVGEKNPMYGKHHSDKTKQKISEAKKNPSEETRRKMRRPKTEIEKQHMRESKPKKSVVQYTMDLKCVAKYESLREAERQTGVSHSHITNCCKGKRNYNTAGGFIWCYV